MLSTSSAFMENKGGNSHVFFYVGFDSFWRHVILSISIVRDQRPQCVTVCCCPTAAKGDKGDRGTPGIPGVPGKAPPSLQIQHIHFSLLLDHLVIQSMAWTHVWAAC